MLLPSQVLSPKLPRKQVLVRCLVPLRLTHSPSGSQALQDPHEVQQPGAVNS